MGKLVIKFCINFPKLDQWYEILPSMGSHNPKNALAKYMNVISNSFPNS